MERIRIDGHQQKKKGILYKVILHELGWSIGLVFQSSFRGGFLYIWAAVKGMI